MKVKDLNAFCITPDNNIGIAIPGTTSAQAFRLGGDFYQTLGGNKFSWMAPDGGDYTDSKDIFSRPTEDQITRLISPRLKEKAIELNLIEP